MAGIWSKLDEVPYPFKDNAPGLSVARFAILELPKTDDVVGFYQAIEAFCDAFNDLRTRMALYLMAHAAEGERAMGLEPLPKAEGPTSNEMLPTPAPPQTSRT